MNICVPYGPKMYLIESCSHEGCGLDDFFIAFVMLMLRDGHKHILSFVFTHDSGTVEHQSLPTATLNI